MAFFYKGMLLFLIIGGQLLAKEVKIRILHTTDIHCQINTHKGGWTKLAGSIAACRKKWGEDSTLLIDCGDTIQGSIEALATQGEVAIDFMNHLRYDAWALGNHELDFGLKRLDELLAMTKVPILSGNFVMKAPYERSFEAYRIYNKQGVKIAVIGMQASFLRHWFIGRDFEGYEVQKVVEVLPAVLKDLKKHKPHMIVLALHHGFNFSESRGVNEIREVTRLFPQLDLVLGGHTHQFYPGRNIYGTYYCQAGFHASHLGVVECALNSEEFSKPHLSSWLIDVEKEVCVDQGAVALENKWQSVIDTYANEFIVDLPKGVHFNGKSGKQNQTATLIGQAIAELTNADIAIHGKFTSKSLSGQVLQKDLFELIPYENNIFILEVSKEQLMLLMQEQMKYFGKAHFNRPFGFKLILDSQVFLMDLQLKGKGPYKLAVNSRVAAGGGGRFPFIRRLIKEDKIPVKEIEINTRQAVKAFLKAGAPLQIDEYFIER